MSFSQEAKREIAGSRPLRTRCRLPLARGLFRFSRSFEPGAVGLHTELEEVAELYARLARSLLGRGTQVEQEPLQRRGKVMYQVALPQAERRRQLIELLDGADGGNCPPPAGQEEVAAFLAGAFLACGNVTDPQKSYHLEFVTQREELAGELAGQLEETIPGAKRSIRRGSWVVYYKECAQIEDLLTLMGASRSSLAMIDVEMLKSVRNQANRATNCETANIDKMVSAAASQMEDIQLVLERVGEGALPGKLREVARLRMDYPEASLRELAELSPQPISRSGVHHRLEKLSRMARELRGEE